MYRMAICDDESVAMEYIVNRMRQQFDLLGIPLECDAYSDSVCLEKQLQNNNIYDMLLLDIDMPRLNGIELCRRFRAQSGEALVVFVSNKQDLVFQTFQVQPFRFVRKKLFSQQVEKLCHDLSQELAKRENHWLHFEDRRGQILTLSIQKLLYVQARGKLCRFVSSSFDSEIEIPFHTVCKALSPSDFIQIHRSYLVNPSYIFRIARDTVMLDNGESLMISRRRHEQVKSQFLSWNCGRS